MTMRTPTWILGAPGASPATAPSARAATAHGAVPAVALAAFLAVAPPSLVAQAPPPPDPIVSAAWLMERAENPDVVVLQVEGSRDPYDRGHVPGARFLPLGSIVWQGPPGREWGTELRPVPELEEALEAVGVRDDTHVVVYSSRTLAATRLWLTLDYLGHGDHASVLDGGLDAWRGAGGTVTTEAPSMGSEGGLTPRPRNGMLVDADWILERMDDPDVVLVDARPDDEYTGADGGMGGMASPGHVPGAVQLEWVELLAADGRFLEMDELRRKLETAGVRDGRTMVSYCMIGMRASLNYLVARALGMDVRFYDGSWHEWGTRDDLPTVTGDAPGGRRR